MINVTKPYLPPKEEYTKYVDEIWSRCWLTNNGPLVNELEINLKDYLGLEHLLFVGNGPIAIQIAIKALDLKGEIITTPFHMWRRRAGLSGKTASLFLWTSTSGR